MNKRLVFLLSLLVALFCHAGLAQNKTTLALDQLPGCKFPTGTIITTPVLLAQGPSAAMGPMAFQCYVLVGAVITPATATTPATITLPSQVVPAFVDNETPAGALDGSNAAFTLANIPAPAASLHLSRNGLLQRAGIDYTLNGGAVTFVAGAVPQPGDILLATYRH